MHSRQSVLTFALIVLALLMLAGLMRTREVDQPGLGHDNIGAGQAYVLNGRVDDSLFVMAQHIDLRERSYVTGDAAFIGGTLRANGRVEGNLTATGSNLRLGPGSEVRGDVTLVGERITVDGRISGTLTLSGNQITISPTAMLNGEVSACADTLNDGRAQPGPIAPCGSLGPVEAFVTGTAQAAVALESAGLSGVPTSAGAVALAVLGSLALAGLAALAVALFPGHIRQMEHRIRMEARRQLLAGFLVFLVMVAFGSGFVALLAAIPLLGLVLLPLLLIAIVIFATALFAGLAALAVVFGGWLLRRVSASAWPPLVAATVGSATLALLLLLPALLPSGGLLSLAAMALVGVTAAGIGISTRLGKPAMRGRYPL